MRWLDLSVLAGSLATQLETHKSGLLRKEYVGLKLVGWEAAEFPQAFGPLLPPLLHLGSCRGLDATFQSLATACGSQEACGGSEASAEEGIEESIGMRQLTLWNGGLTGLPRSIGLLAGLQRIDLSYCNELVSLPVEVGHLTALRTLDLTECSQLAALPVEVGLLTNLRTLNMSGCSRLTALPVEVGQLTSLHTLSLRRCQRLTALPVDVGLMTSLQALELSACKKLATLPMEVSHLTNLRTLDLGGCKKLACLPPLDQFAGLRVLNISFCPALAALL